MITPLRLTRHESNPQAGNQITVHSLKTGNPSRCAPEFRKSSTNDTTHFASAFIQTNSIFLRPGGRPHHELRINTAAETGFQSMHPAFVVCTERAAGEAIRHQSRELHRPDQARANPMRKSWLQLALDRISEGRLWRRPWGGRGEPKQLKVALPKQHFEHDAQSVANWNADCRGNGGSVF